MSGRSEENEDIFGEYQTRTALNSLVAPFELARRDTTLPANDRGMAEETLNQIQTLLNLATEQKATMHRLEERVKALEDSAISAQLLRLLKAIGRGAKSFGEMMGIIGSAIKRFCMETFPNNASLATKIVGDAMSRVKKATKDMRVGAKHNFASYLLDSHNLSKDIKEAKELRLKAVGEKFKAGKRADDYKYMVGIAKRAPEAQQKEALAVASRLGLETSGYTQEAANILGYYKSKHPEATPTTQGLMAKFIANNPEASLAEFDKAGAFLKSFQDARAGNTTTLSSEDEKRLLAEMRTGRAENYPSSWHESIGHVAGAISVEEASYGMLGIYLDSNPDTSLKDTKKLVEFVKTENFKNADSKEKEEMLGEKTTEMKKSLRAKAKEGFEAGLGAARRKFTLKGRQGYSPLK